MPHVVRVSSCAKKRNRGKALQLFGNFYPQVSSFTTYSCPELSVRVPYAAGPGVGLRS